MATRLTLSDSNTEVSIALEQESLTLDDLMNEGVVPLLLAFGYAVESINNSLCDGCVSRERDDEDDEDVEAPPDLEGFLSDLKGISEDEDDDDDEYSIWYRSEIPGCEGGTCCPPPDEDEVTYVPAYNEASEEEE